MDVRKNDSFGIGFYYNGVSGDLKNSVGQLTGGKLNLRSEKGLEIFYDVAITPAVRLVPSYQHIWQPLIAQVASQQNSADVFLLRLNLAL
jgi:porin